MSVKSTLCRRRLDEAGGSRTIANVYRNRNVDLNRRQIEDLKARSLPPLLRLQLHYRPVANASFSSNEMRALGGRESVAAAVVTRRVRWYTGKRGVTSSVRAVVRARRTPRECFDGSTANTASCISRYATATDAFWVLSAVHMNAR